VGFDKYNAAFGAQDRYGDSRESSPRTHINNAKRPDWKLGRYEQRFAVVKVNHLLNGVDSSKIEARVPLNKEVIVRLELIELLLSKRAKRCEFARQQFAKHTRISLLQA
jgi:hypothetical protein